MRRVRYGGAMSLDGFIAGPNGEYDWIPMDPDFDFAGHMQAFDTFLIGRKTFTAVAGMGNGGAMRGIENIVFSRTLKPADFPGVRIETDAVGVVTELKRRPGKDIAIFGGGELFRSLADAGLVDSVEMSVVPVMLGRGIPVVPAGSRVHLKLREHKAYPKTGTVSLQYEVVRA